MRNYSTQIKNELKDKIDLVSGRKEGAPDYFAYIRGSGITEDTQESGYRGAVAAALRASNEYDTTFQTDADLCIRTIEDVYTAAQEADANCCAKLRAVIESLQEWKLLARKLNLSITGGGGYQEQLFTANNIRCWVGNVPQTVAQASVDCWKDIFTDVNPTTGEVTYNQAALTDYFALSEEVYTQDSLNSVFAIMTAGLVEATDLVCLTSDRNFNAEQFNLLMQCGTTQIFSADNPLTASGMSTSYLQGDEQYYYVNYDVSPVLSLFANSYSAVIDERFQTDPRIFTYMMAECKINPKCDANCDTYQNICDYLQQAHYSDVLNYFTSGNCISLAKTFSEEEIDAAYEAVISGTATQANMEAAEIDPEGNYYLDYSINVGAYVPAEFHVDFLNYEDYCDLYKQIPVSVETSLIISNYTHDNADDEEEAVSVLHNCEAGELLFSVLSVNLDQCDFQEKVVEAIDNAYVDTSADSAGVATSVSLAVAKEVIGYLCPLSAGAGIVVSIGESVLDSAVAMSESQRLAKNVNEKISKAEEANYERNLITSLSPIASYYDEGTNSTLMRLLISPSYIQLDLCYLYKYSQYDNPDHTFSEMHTYDEFCELSQNGNETNEEWYRTFLANGGKGSVGDIDQYIDILEPIWTEYCDSVGYSQISQLPLYFVSPDDVIQLANAELCNDTSVINIDLSKYIEYSAFVRKNE